MSSDDYAIRAENLGKCYQIYGRPQDRLKQSIVPRLRTIAGLEVKRYYREFWALKDFSLEIRKGETVGIVGRNGSGKSTLLQMICGTLSPTTGTVKARGRIAALLELGAGFNPEFTGHENIYMNGAVLGLTPDEIDARFDDIVTFADIGDFIEQPVKQYSSGMFARLAFAVAINVDPDILVVDEALSVGDEAFQRKCFARMEQIKSNGATILFVSHSAATVTQLCDRAVLLDRGMHLYTGRPKRTVAWYQKLVAAPEEARSTIAHEILADQITSSKVEIDAIPMSDDFPPQASTSISTSVPADASSKQDSLHDPHVVAKWDAHLISQSVIRFATNGAEISDVRIETLAGTRVNCLVPRERYQLRYEVRFEQTGRSIKYHFGIRTVTGVALGGGMTPSGMASLPLIDAHSVHEVIFEFDCNLTPGTYFLNCGVTGDGEVLHRLMDIIMFRVQLGEPSHAFGFVDFAIEARTTHLESVK